MKTAFNKARALVRRRLLKFYNVRKLTILPHSRQPPTHSGIRGYWTTLTGKPIHNPNGYPWPKRYHKSTYIVSVGEWWIDDEATLPAGYSWKFDVNGLRIVHHRSGKELTPDHLPENVPLRIKQRRLAGYVR